MSTERKVILVDLLDKPLGEMGKQAAHESPNLHRAFSVFLYHGTKMLIQQRALHKYHTPGLWANACCSHPQPGERLIESATKRLHEEAGINCQSLEHLFSFTYLAPFHADLFEYELDHVFLGEYAGDFILNPAEVAAMEWIECRTLLEEMRTHPQKFAPWFIICGPQVARIILDK